MRLMQRIKNRYPSVVRFVRRAKASAKTLSALRYHSTDLMHSYRHMRWDRPSQSYWRHSAELLFQYHKLEKGMSMPGAPRFFGDAPAMETMRLLHIWRERGFEQQDPIYQGCIETLRAYLARTSRFIDTNPVAARVAPLVAVALENQPQIESLSTPRPLRPPLEASDAVFSSLVMARRSVRNFKPDPVPPKLLNDAVGLAQWSPSACNRQPWIVHAFSERAEIDALLTLQNGNRGFGHLVPLLLVLSVQSETSFDASERNQGFIDGGLFTMSLVYALQSKGLSTCCLNWCVAPDVDYRAKAAGGIPESERILMFLAVGFPAEDCVVPRSPRRPLDSFVRWH